MFEECARLAYLNSISQNEIHSFQTLFPPRNNDSAGGSSGLWLHRDSRWWCLHSLGFRHWRHESTSLSLSHTHTLIHTPFFSALSVCYISAESNSSRKQAVTSNEVVWINAAFPLTFYIVTSVCVKTIERYTLHYSSRPSESLCSALEAQRKQN